MDAVLTDPDGRTVDASYPGATVDDSQIPSLIVVKDPAAGTWSVQVHAPETSQADESYYSVVSFRQTGPARNPDLQLWQVLLAALPVGVVLALVSAFLLAWARRHDAAGAAVRP